MAPDTGKYDQTEIVESDRFCIGNLYEQPPETLVTQELLSQVPLLMRADGNVYRLMDHRRLLGFQLQDNDVYVVGPHGAIVPFVVLAAIRGLLNKEDGRFSGNTLLHVDAHLDNNTRQYSVDVIDMAMNASSSEELQHAFSEVIRRFKKNIAEFIAELGRALIQKVALLYRHSWETNLRYCSPATVKEYLDIRFSNLCDADNSSATIAREIAEECRTVIWSIDADFCGLHPDMQLQTSVPLAQFREDVWNVTQPALIDLLQNVHRLRYEVASQIRTVLYTISVDKMWCNRPLDVLLSFLRDFYLPAMQAQRSN